MDYQEGIERIHEKLYKENYKHTAEARRSLAKNNSAWKPFFDIWNLDNDLPEIITKENDMNCLNADLNKEQLKQIQEIFTEYDPYILYSGTPDIKKCTENYLKGPFRTEQTFDANHSTQGVSYFFTPSIADALSYGSLSNILRIKLSKQAKCIDSNNLEKAIKSENSMKFNTAELPITPSDNYTQKKKIFNATFVSGVREELIQTLVFGGDVFVQNGLTRPPEHRILKRSATGVLLKE